MADELDKAGFAVPVHYAQQIFGDMGMGFVQQVGQLVSPGFGVISAPCFDLLQNGIATGEFQNQGFHHLAISIDMLTDSCRGRIPPSPCCEAHRSDPDAQGR
jgi:hypothetical protein